MAVILTTPAEVDQRLEADTAEAPALQRPLPDDALRIVAKGEKEDKSPEVTRVIRISITSAAFDAIKATLPVGAAVYEPQRTAQDGYFIWVERSWLNKLEALRQPREGLSETIIRLVAMEAGGRPRRRAAALFGDDGARRSAIKP
jgi:hypothetical protein